MKFPLIMEIASKDVIKVDIHQSINTIIELMYKYDHRNIIIENKSENIFYTVSANDILKLKLQHYDFSLLVSSLKLEKLNTINKNENILDTMYFVKNNIEYICVINDDKSLFGILTYTDIISYIDPESLMENYRLSDLINLNKEIATCTKDTKTIEALNNIANNDSDCVVVLENNKAIGIVTTKDILKFFKNSKVLDLSIEENMSGPVISLNDNSTIKEAISFMKEKHFKRVVITSDNKEFKGLILQKELISLSYSKWAILMKEYSSELSEINTLLEHKNTKFEKMAFTDQLTGLYNRYKFTELFILEYKTMIQRDNKMSLLMIDIDFFKKINDTYGHNIGDAILLQLSNILLRQSRNVDIISRWGGEEFLILLPTATLENAVKLSENIRLAIQNHDMDEHLKVTVSIGVTEVRVGDDIKDTVKRADEALYEAKNSGRNCVRTDNFGTLN